MQLLEWITHRYVRSGVFTSRVDWFSLDRRTLVCKYVLLSARLYAITNYRCLPRPG